MNLKGLEDFNKKIIQHKQAFPLLFIQRRRANLAEPEHIDKGSHLCERFAGLFVLLGGVYYIYTIYY
jgi:hypothetical protein